MLKYLVGVQLLKTRICGHEGVAVESTKTTTVSAPTAKPKTPSLVKSTKITTVSAPTSKPNTPSLVESTKNVAAPTTKANAPALVPTTESPHTSGASASRTPSPERSTARTHAAVKGTIRGTTRNTTRWTTHGSIRGTTSGITRDTTRETTRGTTRVTTRGATRAITRRLSSTRRAIVLVIDREFDGNNKIVLPDKADFIDGPTTVQRPSPEASSLPPEPPASPNPAIRPIRQPSTGKLSQLSVATGLRTDSSPISDSSAMADSSPMTDSSAMTDSSPMVDSSPTTDSSPMSDKTVDHRELSTIGELSVIAELSVIGELSAIAELSDIGELSVLKPVATDNWDSLPVDGCLIGRMAGFGEAGGSGGRLDASGLGRCTVVGPSIKSALSGSTILLLPSNSLSITNTIALLVLLSRRVIARVAPRVVTRVVPRVVLRVVSRVIPLVVPRIDPCVVQRVVLRVVPRMVPFTAAWVLAVDRSGDGVLDAEAPDV